MKMPFFFLALLFASSSIAQDISGEWTSENVNAYKLKNETAQRVYRILINKKAKSLEGESKIYFKSKEGFLKTVLFGKVDTVNHTIILHTENFRSSVDGTEEHMKDNNKYIFSYRLEGNKEFLELVRDEAYPHIMLDSFILFSRIKVSIKPQATAQEVVQVKTDAVVQHPVATRTNKLFKEILANADSIKVDLYDVGEIDGDSVSLFLNDKLIAQHQVLKANATTFYLKLDRNIAENKLVMFAENLGRIPPNTAYMVITVGKKEYAINMQSDEQTNGEVVLRFTK